MGNQLFQLAKSAVHRAEVSNVQADIEVAKNNLSSAFANSTPAEQRQLQEMQQRLDQVQNKS